MKTLHILIITFPSLLVYWAGAVATYRWNYLRQGKPDNNGYGWFDNDTRRWMIAFWFIVLPIQLGHIIATREPRKSEELVGAPPPKRSFLEGEE